jgi:hypothetical protein
MPDVPDITVKPLPGISREQALDARVRAWGFVWECFRRHEGQNGGSVLAAPDDTRGESKRDSRTKTTIP